jgi:hypothetical protein
MTGITLLHTASHQRYSVTAQYPTTPRASKVETQNLASHKQTYAIYWDDETPVIVAFIARETQDFASHKQTYAIYWDDETPVIAALFPCETQDFASLLGRMRYLLRCWNACRCRTFYSGDAKSCVSTGEDAPFIGMMKYLPLPRFLLGRRKILRLYWGGCAIY